MKHMQWIAGRVALLLAGLLLLDGCARSAAPPSASVATAREAATAPGPSPSPNAGVAGRLAALPRARVMVLGTFHFQDAGLDRFRPRHHVDVRSTDRQEQVQELMALLAAFEPTRIAIEQPRSRQPRLDSLYAEYRAGRWQLGANEIYQLGFRLAARLGHDRVHAVDAEDHAYLGRIFRENQSELEVVPARDSAAHELFLELYAESDALKMSTTLREWYLHVNSPDRYPMMHGHYLINGFRAEGQDGYLGVDASLGWYSRNLRIFRNLQRITESPDDRILLIVGSGHLPTLRFLIDASPDHRWVDVAQYLTSPVRGHSD